MTSKWRLWLLIIVVLALSIGAAVPVLASVEGAGVKGAPQLEATVIGSNELPAGQSATVQIMLLNKGTFTGEVKNPADKAMARGYTSTVGATVVPPCTTAVAVTATLVSANDTIQILSGTAGIGALPTGSSTAQPISFQIRVAQHAQPATYQLKLQLQYQYLDSVVWLNSPEQNTPYYDPQFEFHWSQKQQAQDIAIKIFGTYFSVTKVKTDSIRAGATGIITATIENSGASTAADVIAEIAPGGNFVPVDRGVFLGDLSGGQSQVAAFRVTVSPEAIAKTSPLDISIKYKDENNVARLTTVSVGVPVGGVQKNFSVTNVKTDGIRAGSTGIITLTLRDEAAGDAHEVTIELVPGAYFVPVDIRSFLGDLKNGSSSTTQFKVSVSKDAIAKTSPLDIMVKYNDSNNIQRQSLVTVGIPVKEAPQFEIESVKGNLVPGATTIIEIPIKNISDYTLNDAIARINIVDPFATAPFSTTDEAAYIGTLKAGASGTGKFKLTVDADAVPKAYTLEVQIKYWDSLNNSYTSDLIKAVVTVQPSPRFSITTIVLISLAALVVIIILVNIIRRSRKQARSQ